MATHLDQQALLLCGLDALRQHLHAQTVGQRDRVGDDGAVAGIMVKATDEALIDLEAASAQVAHVEQ